MNILFLGIKGVLNHHNWFNSRMYEEAREMASEEDIEVTDFDPTSIMRINSITTYSNSKIVLVGLDEKISLTRIQSILKLVGLEEEVIGIVRNLQAKMPDGNPLIISRGINIDLWMSNHETTIENYAIIDSKKDYLLHHHYHFESCHPQIGVSSNNIENVLRIFKNEIKV